MKSQNNNRKKTYRILSLFFGIILVCCLIWLAAYLIGLKKAENEMDAIFNSYISEGSTQAAGGGAAAAADNASGADITGTAGESGISTAAGSEGADAAEDTDNSDNDGVAAEGETPPDDLSVYGITDRSIDWAALQEEENKDIYAWIVVPGTAIDYPVLQHPEEMDYYLEHNLDGSKGRPGCIYTQRMNSKDWSDRNTVLYGHNMRVGTMFAGLHDFEDADFFEENRYIHIYSEDGRILIYEIFAAYAFSDAHILLTYDFYTEEGYEQYLDTVRKSAEKQGYFREEAAPGKEDNIITLSTCIRGSNSQRYLVQGVLIAEGEQP
ncbi:MAG: class B sortase [Butyrivibrio sp.]|nr:class B sortase [Acetatifactor muris]MCM1561553.1 class B sortase [Butyrivibrio sp.]